jgi:hypothetical protein
MPILFKLFLLKIILGVKGETTKRRGNGRWGRAKPFFLQVVYLFLAHFFSYSIHSIHTCQISMCGFKMLP